MKYWIHEEGKRKKGRKKMLNTKRFAMAVAATMGLLASIAGATVYTYTGPATSAVWNDSANWGGAGVPGAGDTANIDYAVTFTNFDGQSAGVINVSAGKLTFNGAGTFTMNNSGSDASISAIQLSFTSTTSMVLAFAGNLTLDVKVTSSSNEFYTKNTTIQGAGTVTVKVDNYGWKGDNGTVISAARLDASDVNRFRAAKQEFPDVGGVQVDLGSLAQLRADFPSEASFDGLTGCRLEMDSSYQLFGHSTEENIQLASWKVGTTTLPNGTYDVNSTDIGDADFSVIFSGAGTTMSFTVIPEPATMAILALGGLGVLMRRKRA
ncbi:MAG TPA: hypothetical protein DCX07_06395 [Phycisphaerales bacterium]|nr:hypothetical protein [Phycisphaerales bacterium]